MRPPVSVYLAALVRRLTTICSSRVGSASSRKRPRSSETVELVLPLLDERADRSRRHWSRIGASVDELLAELDLAAGDPGDVEQVVDQPGEVLDLPLDDVRRPVEVAPASSRAVGDAARRC